MAVEGAWVGNAQSRVRLVSAWSTAPLGGGEVTVAVEFELAPGWHVYWKNSGDAGYPPALDWSSSPGVDAGPLLFPAPHRFELPGGLESFGYDGAVLYPLRVRPRAATAETLFLRARLDYLVCAEECIPYSADLALDLPLGAPREDPAVAARLAAWERRLPRSLDALDDPPRLAVRYQPGDDRSGTLELTLEGGGLAPSAPDLFFETHPLYALGRPALTLTATGLRFRVPIRPLDETRPAPVETDFAWAITGLARRGDTLALAGNSRVTIGSAVGPVSYGNFRFVIPAALLTAVVVLVAARLRRRSTARS